MGSEAVSKAGDGVNVRRRASVPIPARPISHNLNGQRLGRKGRDTRDRIIATTQQILSEPSDGSLITLSEVARRASLRMSTLYIYFADLTELVLAVLDPVMATAEDEFVHLVREPWPDAELGTRALAFVRAYHAFWLKHGRVLHLRNNMGDRGDLRMMEHRVRSAIPVMRLLVRQMGQDSDARGNLVTSTSTALMTGLDRVATVMTEGKLPQVVNEPANPIDLLLQAQARLFELAIRDQREQGRARG